VGLFGMEARARVCAFWACWRVCVPFCLVGACVCLFGLLEQLMGLFGMEARARVCAFLACWSTWWAFLALRQGGVCVPFWIVGACVCLFGLLAQLVGLFGMEARARVCAFLSCWRVCVPF